MFSLGVYALIVGYACLYTGVANLLNRGAGPTLREAVGIKTALAPPGADYPNLTGQPPNPNTTPPSADNGGGGGGGTTW